jgi:hypothetical protein
MVPRRIERIDTINDNPTAEFWKEVEMKQG